MAIVVGVQVRQRYAPTIRGVEAVAVHEHDAGVLGESCTTMSSEA